MIESKRADAPLIPPSSAGRFSAGRAWILSVALLGAFGLNAGCGSPGERGSDEAEVEPALAIVDVRYLTDPDDPVPGAMMTHLLEIGLADASPHRIISLELLRDLRRRMFEPSRGPIEPEAALEIARAADATALLLCDLTESGGTRQVLWRLVDTVSGADLGSRRVEGGEFAALADGVVVSVLPLLAPDAGPDASAPPSVMDITTTSPEAYRHYMAGMLAMDGSDYRTAAEELASAIAIDSTFALAHLEYARLAGFASMHLRGRSADLAKEFRDRLGRRDQWRLDALRARFGGTPADHAKEIDTHRKILSRWPDDPNAIVDLMGLLEKTWGDRQEILTLAERGAALYPDDRRMLEWYENALANAGRCDESIAVVRDYMRRHPEAADLIANIGGTFLGCSGLPDSAEVYLQQAVELNPNVGWYQVFLAKCAYMRGDVEEAIRRRDQPDAIAATTDTPGLAQLHADLGRMNVAFEMMDKVLGEAEAAGRHHDARMVRLSKNLLRVRTGRAHEVVEEVAHPFYEGHRTARIFRSWALASLDSVDAALALVDSIRSESGADSAWYAYYVRKTQADVALAQGRPEETLSLLLPERLSLYMIDLDRRKSIVRAYRMLDRHEDAEEELREILRRYGGHAVAHRDLGRVLEDLERFDEAESEYERFLEMWSDADEGLPQLTDARERLEALRARTAP